MPAVTQSPSLIGRRALLRSGIGLSGVGLAAACLPFPLAAQTTGTPGLRFFQIGTGTTGGTYFLIGGLLANAISNPPGSLPCERGGSCGVPGLIVVAQSTSGAVENVEGIREGRLESGLVQADIAYAAFRGEGAFEGRKPLTELRSIANLYTETIHLVVRADSGIRSVADLKGKRLVLGEKGSGTLVTARILLAAYGLSEKSVKPLYLSPGAASDRIASGEADGFFIVGGFPLPAVADLAGRVAIRLLSFDETHLSRIARRLPFYTGAVIEDGAYAGVPPTPTLGVGAQWLVHNRISEDLVYGITRALWNERTRELLVTGHPRGSTIRLETALKGLAVPLHPGAERFYREVGMAGDSAAVVPGTAGRDAGAGPAGASPVPRTKPAAPPDRSGTPR
ncbi:TAXI family TRAP transporter solute-binding subunit [Rhodocista pekingensis]|uniref:TAXI family TRAP transporter solute-binding subunit n=1 Tax=Rhodocista pekingensis TaxID=201185 RepID=A0ABW2KXS5_9PROT